MNNFYVNPNAIIAPNMPGFYIHPDFPGYAINREGKVWSFKSNRFLVPWINPDSGRYRTALRDTTGRRQEMFLHRLLGWLFVPLPDRFNNDYNSATINHIDHNKINNNIENLEWLTALENLRDGLDSGCYENSGASQRRPCFCIDIYTRNYVEAVSTGKLDQYFNWRNGITRGAIHRRQGTAVIYARYIVDYLDDPKWMDIDIRSNIESIIDEYLPNSTHASPKLLIDNQTGEITQYNSLQELTTFFKGEEHKIRYAINNGSTFRKRYHIKNLSEVMNDYYKTFHNE